MGGEHNLVFPFVGAGGNPHWTCLGLPLLTQLPGIDQQLRVDAQVKLDRAGHFNAFRSCTQLAEALGLGFGLHGDQAHFCQHGPGQAGKAAITLGRAGRQPGIGQRHRDATLGALVDMVGPQLGFHDHRELGLHTIQKPRCGPRQIVGQVAMLDTRLTREQRLDPLGPGGRHAGHGDWQLWITFKQCSNHRRGGDTLAHRYGMHPDAARLHGRQIYGETLTNAPGISGCLARPQPQTNRHQRQPQMKQQGVESSIHGCGVYLKKYSR